MESPIRSEVPNDPADAGGESLAFYRVLFQQAHQGIIVQDAGGRVTHANPAATRILGLSLDQLQGRCSRDPRWRAVREDGSPFPGEAHPALAALRTGEPVENRVMGVFNPELGRTVWLEVSAVPVFHPGERAPFQVVSTFLDITARKEAQDALAASEAKFSTAFHASPDSVNLNRLADGVYVAVNEGFTRMTGYRPEDVLGRSSLPDGLGIWVDPADRERLLEGLRRDGLVQGLEAPFRRKDGSVLTGLMSASLVPVDGQPCVLTITRDITERARAEEERREAHQFNQQIIHGAQEGIIVYGADLRYRIWNPYMEALTGIPASEVLGRQPLEMFPFLQGTQVLERLRQALAGQPTSVHDFPYLVPATGRSGWASDTIAPLFNTRGEVIGAIGMVRDITEARRAEAAFRESAQRLELATSSGSLGVWELNLADGTQIWNDRMYQIYGLEPQSSHPDHAYWCRRIVHPDDLVATDAGIQEALAGRRPYDFEFRVLRPDGEVRHIKSDGLLIRDAEGRPARMIGINRDRTREVAAEAERRRLLLDLQHADKMESLGSLAGGVAHDMNNVLAAIMGTASMLREIAPDPELQAKALDTITLACTRGRDVVRSLLYFSRKDLEAEAPADLNIIAKEMVQLLAHTTLNRVQLSTDFQEPLDLIRGDAGALGHALINLCVNAVDAMPEGGWLTLRTRNLDSGWVLLEVEDTGTGMTPAVSNQALNPFFTTKPQGKGTGLGLSMVYSTVQAHRGQLEIRSEPGRGTCVSLRFPGAGA